MKMKSTLVVVLTLLGTSAALGQYNDNNSSRDRGANGQQQTEPQGRNNNQDKSQNTNQRGQNQSGSQEAGSSENRQGSDEVRDNPHFSRGDKLSSEYRDNSHVVSDWKGNHLRQPPSGYHWVQANNQYVLAAVASGVIADIMMSNQNQRTR